eukprot:TRINITY_DN649_c0_g1_i10.p2 TRINITY_DN649_c0_g1~~TRINITY_DN649_c0_g1_i10.p2  ORF type:complete len:122 (-),score=64.85 TRINITY_DN649_c0_g1_i10:46-411(-)
MCIRDRFAATWCVHHAFAFLKGGEKGDVFTLGNRENFFFAQIAEIDAVPKREHICLRSSRANPVLCVDTTCLLYTSDAADDLLCVDLGGRRIIKKKKKKKRRDNRRRDREESIKEKGEERM